jgi:hypothetical protein
MQRSIRSAAALTLLVTALSPADADSQSSRFLNAVGYGFTGGSLGLAATLGVSCPDGGIVCVPGEMVAATLGGTVLGLILGWNVASTANRMVAEGRPVGGGRLAALSFGTVVGGAALGLLAGGLLINPEGAGTALGSDEQTLSILAFAGGTPGFLQLVRNWSRLTGSAVVQVNPLVTVHGRPGVVLRLHF